MLLDPLSHKRTVVSGLNTVQYHSITPSGGKDNYTFHGQQCQKHAQAKIDMMLHMVVYPSFSNSLLKIIIHWVWKRFNTGQSSLNHFLFIYFLSFCLKWQNINHNLSTVQLYNVSCDTVDECVLNCYSAAVKELLKFLHYDRWHVFYNRIELKTGIYNNDT